MLRIILGYDNNKLRDCALSISYLRRHPYVLLPYNNTAINNFIHRLFTDSKI